MCRAEITKQKCGLMDLVSMHSFPCSELQARACLCVSACVYMCVRVCMPACMCVCVRASARVCSCVRAYMRVCVCVSTVEAIP